MKKLASLALGLLAASAAAAQAQIVVSGYMANPAGTDSPYEYVQLVATQNINFATTPYTVVFANNGTATTSGWIAGGSLTYNLNLTLGSVTAGQVFYVGGSGQLVNGAGTADISGGGFLSIKNTGSANGDNFGTGATAGVVGNGGTNADGIAVFAGLGSGLTPNSIPVDAIFYGSAVGTAYPGGASGYTVPTNDRYMTGIFGANTNTFLFNDPAGGQYTRLTGTYDPTVGAFTTARTSSLLTPTTLSDIGSTITVVPEPSTYALVALAGAGLFIVVRRRTALA